MDWFLYDNGLRLKRVNDVHNHPKKKLKYKVFYSVVNLLLGLYTDIYVDYSWMSVFTPKTGKYNPSEQTFCNRRDITYKNFV